MPLVAQAHEDSDAAGPDSNCESNLDTPCVRTHNTVQLSSGKYLAQLSSTGSRDEGETNARCGVGKLVRELVGEAGLRGCEQKCTADRSIPYARGTHLV